MENRPLKGIALALASMTAASTWAAQQGNPSMDNATRTRIAAAAARSAHWRTGDIVVKPNDDLDRGGCTFLLAYNGSANDVPPLHYALLPDGRIAGVDLTGNAAVTALLRACGKQADANWWAAVVTRFSGEAGGAPLTADSFASQIEEVRKAGGDFKPPVLTRSEGASRLEFFSLGTAVPVGGYIPYQVTAILPDQGELTVTVKNLRTGTSH